MSDRRRVHLLLGTLTGLALAFGASSVGLSSLLFPPHFQGWGELTRVGTIAGWAVKRGAPAERVEVQLYVDGHFVAAATADRPRPDVRAARYSKDERCGYEFTLPPLEAGEHEARIYALHRVGAGAYRTLQLTGRPVRFKTGPAAGRGAAPGAE